MFKITFLVSFCVCVLFFFKSVVQTGKIDHLGFPLHTFEGREMCDPKSNVSTHFVSAPTRTICSLLSTVHALCTE